MCKQFTKASLKDGMVVKYRGSSSYSLANDNDGLRIVLSGYSISHDSYNDLKGYSDDLVYAQKRCFDIVEVFEVTSVVGGLDNITNWRLKSIWKREEKSQNQLEIDKIQAEMDSLKQRLEELKGKV